MKKVWGGVVSALMGAAALSALSASASAAVTFDYVGNPFTSTPDPALGVNGVTASVTLDVPDNFSGVVAASKFETWKLSTGAVTESSSDPSDSLATASIVLDGKGDVTSWSIETFGSPSGKPFIFTSTGEDGVGPDASNFPDFNQVNGNPGIWTEAPVPEPATWAVMLVGFAGVGMAVRRRRFGPAQAALV